MTLFLIGDLFRWLRCPFFYRMS
uniref:Uncharacterized protein n=1 Tax=Rhizophora mucronata TaxID=61149 RepID=A0A2P2Q4N2_RHIMU